MSPLFRPLLIIAGAVLLQTALTPPAPAAARIDDWTEIVRSTPYWASQGVAANLSVIRRWVLRSQSYCERPARHILFDQRGRFLGYIDDGDSPQQTHAQLNSARARMAADGRVKRWSPGAIDGLGYPFALACDQPFADLAQATARMLGEEDEYRLWGTWDGMRIGAPEQQVALTTVFWKVYHHRRQQGRYTFPGSTIRYMLGQIMIESGAVKHARSAHAARGILQLRGSVLDDCNIPDSYHLHRMAQVDCALRLVQQNHRNLAPVFKRVFGHLPQAKRQRLYSLLLVQAYQIGVGRTIELLEDPQLGDAARYFAKHADRFKAEDIAVGMIYHNLGRKDLGLLSLYYVIDAGIAAEALCARADTSDKPWCIVDGLEPLLEVPDE